MDQRRASRISATSIVGRSKEAPARAIASAGAPVYPGGMTSNDNRSSGLCVARIVWVATCV